MDEGTPTDVQRVVFVALGSRGDVQPLALIAHKLAEQHAATLAVSFVTHLELANLVQRLAPQVEVRAIESPCFLGDGHDLVNPMCVVDTKATHHAITRRTPQDALVFNLFGMPPCIHLAEKLCIRTICCTPSLVPYAMPHEFKMQFQDEFADLYAFLISGKACMSWDDVCSWLWPIFTQAHGHLREHLLHLSNVPLLGQTGPANTWHAAPRLIIGIDNELLKHAHCESTRWSLPPNALVCGFWTLPLHDSQNRHQEWPFEDNERPVFVTMGSMGVHGLVDNAEVLIQELCKVLDECNLKAAVHWQHDTAHTHPRLVRLQNEVNYGWAFTKCCYVMHHGGIGTTAECLRAGVPQVIVPVAYDQPFWGDLISRLGVGACAHTPSDISSASRHVMSSHVASAAAKWREKFDSEGACRSTDAACAEIVAAVAAPRPPNEWRENKTLSLRGVLQIELQGLGTVRAKSATEAAWIHNEIFVDRVYTPRGIKTWPGMTVVDVGASVGLFTIFARKVLRASRITVIEPAPESFALCKDNIGALLGQESSVQGDVTCHNCACGADQGFAEMVYFPDLPSNSTLRAHESDKRRQIDESGNFNREIQEYLFESETVVHVRCERLSVLLPEGDVSLLKIDVEGSEMHVLKGVEDQDWPRIHQVAMEIHSDTLLSECIALLGVHFVRVWHVAQDNLVGHYMLYATRARV